MLDPSGGFYSSQDADSEGEEGKFFVWTPDEIAAIIGEGDARIFNEHYDVTAEGNFEEKNILNIKDRSGPEPAGDTANEALAQVLERSREKLFAEREKRIKPFRDEKVLTAWNGLMLAAFADAAGVLGNKAYLDIAKKNAAFIVTELQRDGRLLRTWKDGEAKLNAYIEDYANVADGLMVLYQVTGDTGYLIEARRLSDLMITEFWDEENGGFFFTSIDHEELIVRNKDLYDNATPSGNSVAADVLLRLAELVGEAKYERFAVTVLRLSASMLKRHPQGFGRALCAIDFYAAPTRQVVVIGPPDNGLRSALLQTYLPDSVIVNAVDDGDAETVPLLKDRKMIGGSATGYVCEGFVCQTPAVTVDELKSQLSK